MESRLYGVLLFLPSTHFIITSSVISINVICSNVLLGIISFAKWKTLHSYGLTHLCFTSYIYLHSLNAGTPFWKLVLKQFDDLLVKILIAAAIISFLLALVNGETGLTAFLEPSVRYSFLLSSTDFQYLLSGCICD